MPNPTLILAAALALASPFAGAQAVWRCGSSYSQQPCEGARAVDAPAAPTPAEAARAGQVARTDAKLASELEKARLQRERDAPQAILIGPKETPAAADARPAKDGTKPKAGRLEQFTAVAPGTAAKKNKKKKPGG